MKFGAYMVIAHNISKSFGTQKVLRGVTLKIGQGEIHGLAGVNGAGKSTLIRILSDLLPPDEGHVEIDGILLSRDEVSWRKFTRFVFDRPELIEDYYVMEHLQFNGFLQRLSDQESKTRGTILCDTFDIPTSKRISDLSMGQKVKLSLCINLLTPLSYWILDEPFVHLDQASRQIMTMMLKLLKSNGAGIVITTHEIELLRSIPDQVHVLNNGVLVTINPEAVKKPPVDDALSELLTQAQPDANAIQDQLYWLN